MNQQLYSSNTRTIEELLGKYGYKMIGFTVMTPSIPLIEKNKLKKPATGPHMADTI